MAAPRGFDYFLRGKPLPTVGGTSATTGHDHFLRLRPFLAIQTVSGTSLGGNVASATALANASTVAVDVMGSLATATAEAFFGTQEVGVAIQGSLATATAAANSGTLQVLLDETHTWQFFQLRTRTLE